MTGALDGGRVLRDLEDLAARTSDSQGAQRLWLSEPWYEARAWLREQLRELPVEVEEDEARNLWVTLRGRDPRALVIGSHLDSVPGGGSLDGCLGVVAGLEVLRRLARDGQPALTVRLVDFCEEEGDRSDRPLLGSTAATGGIEPAELESKMSMDGIPTVDLLRQHGIEPTTINRAAAQVRSAAGYLELHIEQSTRLETADAPVGIVTGTAGVERHWVHFAGRRDHTAKPPEQRSDALMAAARFIVALRDQCRGSGAPGAQSLISHIEVAPNIPVIVADSCGVTFDVRSYEPGALAELRDGVFELAERIAAEERVTASFEPRWAIAPAPFDPALVDMGERIVSDLTGRGTRLGSPQLHDAGQIAVAGIPTCMIFVQSRDGVSHSADEFSAPDHVALGVEALHRLSLRAIDWIAEGNGRPMPDLTEGSDG